LIQLVTSSEDTDPEVLAIEYSLRTKLKLCQTYEYPLGGSETKLNDGNLKLLFDAIALDQSDMIVKKSRVNFSLLLAGPASNPEYFLEHSDGHCLIGSECEGTEASTFEALPQCFQLCGDMALNLIRNDIPLEDSVVPGIILAGESI